MQSLEFANWEEEFLSQRRKNKYYMLQVYTQFTHSLQQTHLYGAANKITSDGPKPS